MVRLAWVRIPATSLINVHGGCSVVDSTVYAKETSDFYLYGKMPQ